MENGNYRDLERDGPNTPKETRTCLPLGLIKSSLGSIARCWGPKQGGHMPDPFEKKYVHTPTHAASSFLKTATTRDMQKANEII